MVTGSSQQMQLTMFYEILTVNRKKSKKTLNNKTKKQKNKKQKTKKKTKFGLLFSQNV